MLDDAVAGQRQAGLVAPHRPLNDRQAASPDETGCQRQQEHRDLGSAEPQTIPNAPVGCYDCWVTVQTGVSHATEPTSVGMPKASISAPDEAGVKQVVVTSRWYALALALLFCAALGTRLIGLGGAVTED